MSVNDVSRWHHGALLPATGHSADTTPLLAADSWLVADGRTRALALHRDRFFTSVEASAADGDGTLADDAEEFWDAAVASLPRTGDWFPRVELRAATADSAAFLQLAVRPAPAQERSVVVATLPGEDPRTEPTIKGPDLDRMARARATVRPSGAGEAIIVTSEGFVVEGAYSGLLWWRGSILCAPLLEFDRVDSVTVRSVLALATALGIETYTEAVTPAELEGTELWALSALHGARIVTSWVDGPALAELPGRLAQWRTRLGALRQPL
jgi:branched-subunit amino acid aminotransferase/4-amino-4-deoxychorismate lyase